MNSFVRFIISLLIVGGVVNFAVVLLANSHSQARQRERMAAQKDAFVKIVSRVSTKSRRADMVVESQQVDAHGQAIQTTLLVRQYGNDSYGSDESNPLHIVRVVIPGNQLTIDGLVLEPSDTFAADAPDFQILRGTKLAYFGMVCGKDEGPPEPFQPDPRFTYFPRFEVPPLTRIDPGADLPGSYEVELWRYLWTDISETPPAGLSATVRGLKVTWFKPDVITVQREKTYTAYVDMDGVQLREAVIPTMPGLLDEMLAQKKKQAEAP